MKTLLRAVCLSLLVALSAQAQVKNSFTATATVTNAEVKNQDFKVVNGGNVAIQGTVVKTTGTAAGVVRLFYSNDKISWKRWTTSGTATLGAGDSLIVANVSTPQTIYFVEKPSTYLYYRLSFTGSGTQTSQLTSTVVSSH